MVADLQGVYLIHYTLQCSVSVIIMELWVRQYILVFGNTIFHIFDTIGTDMQIQDY